MSKKKDNQYYKNDCIVTPLIFFGIILILMLFGGWLLVNDLDVKGGSHSITYNVIWSLTTVLCVSIVAFVFLTYIWIKNTIDSKDMTISLTTEDIEKINKMFVKNKVTGYYVTEEDIEKISSTLSGNIKATINKSVDDSTSKEKIETIIKEVSENKES